MFTIEEARIRNSVPPFNVIVTLGELYARARRITRIVKNANMPWYARGTFTHNSRDPENDRIDIASGKESLEEVIILAHELGHAENCRYEPYRWAALQDSLIYMSRGFRPPNGIGLVLEEEVLANDRGRKHLLEICPEIVDEFDRQMKMSLLAFVMRAGSMP